MNRKQHWEQVYNTKAADSVSWFQERAEQSLRLIKNTGIGKNAAIVDVGSGASRLVDELVAEGLPIWQYLTCQWRRWLSPNSVWGNRRMSCTGWKAM